MLHWSDLFSQALQKRKKKSPVVALFRSIAKTPSCFFIIFSVIFILLTERLKIEKGEIWETNAGVFQTLWEKKLCHVLKKLKFSPVIMFKNLTLMLVWQSWYNLFGSSSSQIVDMCIYDILWCLPRSGFSGDHLSHKTMKGGEEGKASSTYILMSE